LKALEHDVAGGRNGNRRPRVLYVVTRGDYGGVQTHLVHLLERLRGDIDMTLAVGGEGYLTARSRALGVRTIVLPELVRQISPLADSRALGKLIGLVRTLKPDVVHAHSSKAGVLGRLAAKLCGKAAVFTAHGWAFALGVPPLRRMAALSVERLAGRWADRIIAVSHANRQLAIERRVAGPEQCVVIHYGIPFMPCLSRKPASAVRIIMVGRFAPQKDHAQLLRAVAGIDASVRVMLVGDGPTRPAIEALARELGVADRVDFLGVRDDVPELLGAADIFVLATNWEGLPISIIEAMRAGLPIVASDVDGAREMVADGIAGFLVPWRDASALRSKLAVLAANPELRARIGSAARQRYEAEFTVDRMVERTRQVYDEVLV
jgi:glycosyltransferase involved in cell wall biosynthesis